LDEDAIAVLERLQPCQGGNVPDCLGHLDLLWNIDKHRVIHSLNVNLDDSKVRFPSRRDQRREGFDRAPSRYHLDPLTGIEDGAEIVRIRFHEAWDRRIPKVKVEGRLTHEVAFGSGESSFPVEALGVCLSPLPSPSLRSRLSPKTRPEVPSATP
jgi:hypothetical protein